MKKENLFYFIFILTIIATRIWVFLFPTKKLILSGVLIHHFWFGIVLVILSLIILRNDVKTRTISIPIGIALMADELVYIISGVGPVSNYWGVYSTLGTIVCIILVFIVRKKIVKSVY